MKVLVDECVDWRLSREIVDHEVKTARQMGWSTIQSGELLALAAKDLAVGSSCEVCFDRWYNSAMAKPMTADEILPLVASLTPRERVRLFRLITSRPNVDAAAAYSAVPAGQDEFATDEEALAWEADGWEGVDYLKVTNGLRVGPKEGLGE